MQADHLLADRAFGIDRMQATLPDKLQEFDYPYR
jgi:hypothetical protein